LSYTALALLNPGKVTLVAKPFVAINTDQVWLLQSKGLDEIVLGMAAGSSELTNF